MNKVVTICVVVLLATLALSGYAYTVYLPGLSNQHQSSSQSSGTTSGSSGNGGYAGPGAASLSIYLTDNPPSAPTLKYLLINVTSITLRYEGNVAGQNATTTSTTTTTTGNSTTTVTANSTTTTTAATNSTESDGTPGSQFTFVIPSAKGTNVNITSLQGEAVFLGTTKIPPGNVTGIVFNISGARAFYGDGSSRQLKVVADGKLMIPVHFTVQRDGSTDLTIDITPNSIHTSQGRAAVLTPVIHVTVVTRGSGTTSTQTAVTSITTTTTNSTLTSTISTNSTSVTTNSTVTSTTGTNSTSSATSTNSTATSS